MNIGPREIVRIGREERSAREVTRRLQVCFLSIGHSTVCYWRDYSVEFEPFPALLFTSDGAGEAPAPAGLLRLLERDWAGAIAVAAF